MLFGVVSKCLCLCLCYNPRYCDLPFVNMKAETHSNCYWNSIIFQKGGRSRDLFQRDQTVWPVRAVWSCLGFRRCQGRGRLRRRVQEEGARPKKGHIPLPIAAPQRGFFSEGQPLQRGCVYSCSSSRWQHRVLEWRGRERKTNGMGVLLLPRYLSAWIRKCKSMGTAYTQIGRSKWG